jgi:hypothetical protein
VGLTVGHPFGHDRGVDWIDGRGCSSVVEHLLAKERVESSNLFIRLIQGFLMQGCLLQGCLMKDPAAQPTSSPISLRRASMVALPR